MWTNSEKEKLLAIKWLRYNILVVTQRVQSILTPSLKLLGLLWVPPGIEPVPTYPASSRDTHVGAFLVLSLCLKGPAWKLRNWRGTRLDLINDWEKEITNSNSLLDYRIPSLIPTIFLELEILNVSFTPRLFLCLHFPLAPCLDVLDSVIPWFCYIPNTDWKDA